MRPLISALILLLTSSDLMRRAGKALTLREETTERPQV